MLSTKITSREIYFPAEIFKFNRYDFALHKVETV